MPYASIRFAADELSSLKTPTMKKANFTHLRSIRTILHSDLRITHHNAVYVCVRLTRAINFLSLRSRESIYSFSCSLSIYNSRSCSAIETYKRYTAFRLLFS